MTLLVIGIIVAGIVAAVVLNKKKSHSELPATGTISESEPAAPVETPAEILPVVEAPVATEEQKAARKANAAKQAAAKKAPAKKPVKKAK